MPYTLKVNGKPMTVDVPGDMPLLWVLRDMLDLKGTKFGCGVGQCGACTVHLTGSAVRSCQMPVSARQGVRDHDDRGAVGRRLASAPAGLGGARRAAVRLLPGRPDHVGGGAAGDKPKPTDADIDRAMNGNLCRCAHLPAHPRRRFNAAAERGGTDDADAPRARPAGGVGMAP